jgi:hypothetical protein
MKTSLLIICLAFILLQLGSCTPYRSLQHADTISQLAGNKFMKNLSRDVIKNIWAISFKLGTEKIIQTKIQLNTKLHTVLPADLLPGFNQLLSEQYHIPIQLLEKHAASWQTVRDVVSFVAKNGSGFHFYKQ